jgi:hypothetical protein
VKWRFHISPGSIPWPVKSAFDTSPGSFSACQRFNLNAHQEGKINVNNYNGLMKDSEHPT